MSNNAMGSSYEQTLQNGNAMYRRPGLASMKSGMSRDHNMSSSRLRLEEEDEGVDGIYTNGVEHEVENPQVQRNMSFNRSMRTVSRDGIVKNGDSLTDFFAPDVFSLVLHNPTTAHRFLKYCQSRACGENIEFLEKVDAYNHTLDQATKLLSEIHSTYTSVESPRQINIPSSQTKQVTSSIKTATNTTLPQLSNIFAGAQDHVERLLASAIYPRFVKHQITTSATVALGDDKSRYQGLGDCFCVTDPAVADNPILFASDGFVDVTGYSRKDIVPRNCRFLQGQMTDKLATKRLRQAVENAEETVELLLNYRKNGDPFWNLLYVSPLMDERGKVAHFLGGQINISTTIHSCTDILRILSLNDEGVPDRPDYDVPTPQNHSANGNGSPRMRSSFFKTLRKERPTAVIEDKIRPEAGMESELVNKLGKMSLKTQVEAFYTAYSKYLVLKWNAKTESLTVQHFSPSSIDLLCLNLPNGGIAPIFDKDIFKILADHEKSSTVLKALKTTVKDNLKRGKAVSVEMGLLTGIETRRNGFGLKGDKRTEERYTAHWTPLKDEHGVPKLVVLTIAPK